MSNALFAIRNLHEKPASADDALAAINARTIDTFPRGKTATVIKPNTVELAFPPGVKDRDLMVEVINATLKYALTNSGTATGELRWESYKAEGFDLAMPTTRTLIADVKPGLVKAAAQLFGSVGVDEAKAEAIFTAVIEKFWKPISLYEQAGGTGDATIEEVESALLVLGNDAVRARAAAAYNAVVSMIDAAEGAVTEQQVIDTFTATINAE